MPRLPRWRAPLPSTATWRLPAPATRRCSASFRSRCGIPLLSKGPTGGRRKRAQQSTKRFSLPAILLRPTRRIAVRSTWLQWPAKLPARSRPTGGMQPKAGVCLKRSLLPMMTLFASPGRRLGRSGPGHRPCAPSPAITRILVTARPPAPCGGVRWQTTGRWTAAAGFRTMIKTMPSLRCKPIFGASVDRLRAHARKPDMRPERAVTARLGAGEGVRARRQGQPFAGPPAKCWAWHP